VPGREVAWEEFVERYSPIITAFARKLGVRPPDIDDLVQDVILRFFSALPEFTYDPEKGRFRGYLKVCTWRVFQKQLGKTISLNGRSIDQVDASEVSVEAVWNDIWETESLRRAVETVRGMYSTRPDRAKTFQAFEMYVLLERPADEVSRELGMSVESVHQAKSRVTKAIREAMAEIDGSAG
jgi:RNA polymerase sigma-70 factor, ECF subfamily